MEKIKEIKQLALKDFVYISWEYKVPPDVRSEWLLGVITKVGKGGDKYPAEIRCLACSTGAIVDVGKIVALTDTILKQTNFDTDTARSFRYKEFNKLTKGEASIHLI